MGAATIQEPPLLARVRYMLLSFKRVVFDPTNFFVWRKKVGTIVSRSSNFPLQIEFVALVAPRHSNMSVRLTSP